MKNKILAFLTLQPYSYLTEIWEDLGRPDQKEFEMTVDEMTRDNQIDCNLERYPVRYKVK